MSIEHHWEERGLYIRYTGSITGAQILRAALDASGDSRFDDIRYAIIDLSKASHSTVNAQDIQELTAHIGAISLSNSNIKNAVVMFPGDESRQALASLYAFLADSVPWEIAVFETLDEARSWIQGN